MSTVSVDPQQLGDLATTLTQTAQQGVELAALAAQIPVDAAAGDAAALMSSGQSLLQNAMEAFMTQIQAVVATRNTFATDSSAAAAANPNLVTISGGDIQVDSGAPDLVTISGGDIPVESGAPQLVTIGGGTFPVDLSQDQPTDLSFLNGPEARANPALAAYAATIIGNTAAAGAFNTEVDLLEPGEGVALVDEGDLL